MGFAWWTLNGPLGSSISTSLETSMNTRPGWYNSARQTYHQRVGYDESGGGFDESDDESDDIGLAGWTPNGPLGYSISMSLETSTMNSRLETSTMNDPLGYSISTSIETMRNARQQQSNGGVN